MAEFYSARGWEIPPLPWTNLSPPFSSGRGGAKMRHLCPLVGYSEGRGMYVVERYVAVRLAMVQAQVERRPSTLRPSWNARRSRQREQGNAVCNARLLGLGKQGHGPLSHFLGNDAEHYAPCHRNGKMHRSASISLHDG